MKFLQNKIDSSWKWIDGSNISSKFLDMFPDLANNKIRPNPIRKCANLVLRDNGDVSIESTNCNNDKHPFICKYGNFKYDK